MTPEALAECRAWVLSRPPAVQAVMRKLPPACTVRPLRPLVCPKREGEVYSYTDDGSVSVVEFGNPVRGFCDPDWLEFVKPARISREQIAAWLDE